MARRRAGAAPAIFAFLAIVHTWPLATNPLALAWPETRRDGRVRMCAVAAAGCVLVSMLPRATFYPRLHEWIPLFRAVRVVARTWGKSRC